MTMASSKVLPILIVLASVFPVVKSEFVHFKHCGGVNSVVNVRLEPCETTFLENKKLVCVLVKGGELEIESVFIPPINSSRMSLKAVAIINGKDVKIPDGKETNPCKTSIYPKCPIVERNLHSFTKVYYLANIVSVGPVKIKLSLRDKETKKLLACARLMVFIV